ncbi:hypothetical protein Vadar_019767 [Vaccinium darrowii]|uniref:Uncharacterized protein n=1 Tax=Vaccinium darrowii TaxID=229202 RepID=A0ACB7YNA5_9ERIC|nr:hypothetical protein Vadar_019767 [Vaccinium darrowii]
MELCCCCVIGSLMFPFIDSAFAPIYMSIHLRGVPLEYMTPALVVRMGSLIGIVTVVDRATSTQQNLSYMRIRVKVSISQPLIPGVYLRMEQGNLAWVQFGYERVFKFCYQCGCIGHQEYRCPHSYEEATDMIHRRIHATRTDPKSNFWVTPELDLYSDGGSP